MGRHTDSLAYRHLYNGKAWLTLRIEIFARDLNTCQICGCLCIGGPNAPNSPVCDHIKDHKGDLDLFYDPANLQTLCKLHHDSTKRSQDLHGYSQETDATGWPIDPLHPANSKS